MEYIGHRQPLASELIFGISFSLFPVASYQLQFCIDQCPVASCFWVVPSFSYLGDSTTVGWCCSVRSANPAPISSQNLFTYLLLFPLLPKLIIANFLGPLQCFSQKILLESQSGPWRVVSGPLFKERDQNIIGKNSRQMQMSGRHILVWRPKQYKGIYMM